MTLLNIITLTLAGMFSYFILGFNIESVIGGTIFGVIVAIYLNFITKNKENIDTKKKNIK